MIRRTEENSLVCPQEAEAPKGEIYTGVLRRVLARVHQRADLLYEDSRKAEVALEEILRQPLPRRYLLMRNSARYRSWFLGDRLLQYSEEKWFASPEEALELADLVRFATHHLSPSEGGAIAEDLRARAWAYRGNCLRILGDLVGATAAFDVARRCRCRGTGDAILEARLADLEASLRSAQGFYDEALRLLRRALVVYSQAGDRHQQGRNLVAQGKVQLDRGNFSKAEWLLRRGLRWIDGLREPRLVLVARHNLVCCALATGDLNRARNMLSSCRKDFQVDAGGAMESRRHHLELLLEKALEEATADPGPMPSVAPEEGETHRSSERNSSARRCSVELL